MERYSHRAQISRDNLDDALTKENAVVPHGKMAEERPVPPSSAVQDRKVSSERGSDQNSSPVSVLLHRRDVEESLSIDSDKDRTPQSSPDRDAIDLKGLLRTASRSAFDTKSFSESPKAFSRKEIGELPVVTPENTPRRLVRQPRVEMTEDGAEVTLELVAVAAVRTPTRPHLPPTPPTGKRRSFSLERPSFAATTSLLDVDASPSRNPHTMTKENPSSPAIRLRFLEATPSPGPRRKSLGICCGAGDVGCFTPEDADSSLVVKRSPQKNVEQTISMFLSRPSSLQGWCDGWQVWTAHFGLTTPLREEEASGTKADIKRVLRNRACDMNSRSQRIRRLKDDLSPFDMTPTKEHDDIVSKSQSFGASGTRSKSPLSSRDATAPSSSSLVEIASTVPSLGAAVWDCVEPEHYSPFLPMRARDDELCYDSDPEDITRRRSHPAARSNSLDTSTTLLRELNQGVLNDPTRWADPNTSRTVSRKLFEHDDEDNLKSEVLELLNETFTLVWHPDIKTDAPNKGKPQAVKAYVERGQQLAKSLIRPKFVWTALNNPSKGRKIEFAKPQTVDLLDITRLLEVNRIDRKRYPFAKPRKCLLMECLDRTMLFEASNEAERDRFVRGLKLLVARLGSKIIVEEESLFDEFFTAVAPVPGTSPVENWTLA